MKNDKAMSREQIRRLTLAAMLTAIVFVLEMLGSMVKLGIFSTASLVLVPIVIGAALLGWQYGAWLGFVFAAAVLLSGDATPFLEFNPVGTIILVIVKGIVAGAISGLVYALFSKTHPVIGSILAAVICPIVNTSLFLFFCRVFFWDLLAQWATGTDATSIGGYAVVYLVGINFIIELALNCILSPIIVRLVGYGKKRFNKE